MRKVQKKKQAILTDLDLKIFKKLLEKKEASLTELLRSTKNSNRDVKRRLDLMERRGFILREKIPKKNKLRISIIRSQGIKIKLILKIFRD